MQGMSVVLVLTKATHLFGVLQVPSSLLATGDATTMTARPFLLNPGGVEPMSKKAYPWSFLRVSSLYACGIVYCLCKSCFSYFYP
jgi:hypothetical protein